jgi:hypothetical protein
MSKPIFINAKSIVARASLLCQGPFTINGPVVCAQGICITIVGGPTIKAEQDGFHMCDALLISKSGIRIDSGLYFGTTPGVIPNAIITSISRDETFANCTHAQLATAYATKSYIDNRLFTASFDVAMIGELHPIDGANAVTIRGDASIESSVSLNGTLRYSTERATARDIAVPAAPVHTISSALVFVNAAAGSASPVLDVTALSDCAAQFINTTECGAQLQPILLRFDYGCAYLDGALKVMKSGARWLCFGHDDVLFPTRAIDSDSVSASCISICDAGRYAALGNPMDAGERGCVHLMRRDGATWKRSCPKMVGYSATTPTRHQGLYCAIDARATIVASANEDTVWIFALSSLQSGDGVCACPVGTLGFTKTATEIAHISIPNIRALAFAANGRMLVVASDASATIYDVVGAVWTARYSFADIRAPISLSSDGLTCFAQNAASATQVLRVALGASAATVLETYDVDPAMLPIETIASNSAGTEWLANCSASARLTTTLRADRTADVSMVVRNNNAERARLSFPGDDVRTFALSRDGACALLCMQSGRIVALY